MPLQTNTVDLEAEAERLRAEMAEVAEEQAEWDGNDQQAQQLMARGNQLDRYAAILDAIRRGEVETVDAFDSVTVAGLSPGEINRVEDTVEANDGVRERDAWVAIGLRDAPFVEHDPDAITQEEFEDTVANIVSDVPLPFVRWAEEQISELSHLGADEGNGYLALVREKQAEQSQNEDG